MRNAVRGCQRHAGGAVECCGAFHLCLDEHFALVRDDDEALVVLGVERVDLEILLGHFLLLVLARAVDVLGRAVRAPPLVHLRMPQRPVPGVEELPALVAHTQPPVVAGSDLPHNDLEAVHVAGRGLALVAPPHAQALPDVGQEVVARAGWAHCAAAGDGRLELEVPRVFLAHKDGGLIGIIAPPEFRAAGCGVASVVEQNCPAHVARAGARQPDGGAAEDRPDAYREVQAAPAVRTDAQRPSTEEVLAQRLALVPRQQTRRHHDHTTRSAGERAVQVLPVELELVKHGSPVCAVDPADPAEPLLPATVATFTRGRQRAPRLERLVSKMLGRARGVFGEPRPLLRPVRRGEGGVVDEDHAGRDEAVGARQREPSSDLLAGACTGPVAVAVEHVLEAGREGDAVDGLHQERVLQRGIAPLPACAVPDSEAAAEIVREGELVELAVHHLPDLGAAREVAPEVRLAELHNCRRPVPVDREAELRVAVRRVALEAEGGDHLRQAAPAGGVPLLRLRHDGEQDAGAVRVRHRVVPHMVLRVGHKNTRRIHVRRRPVHLLLGEQDQIAEDRVVLLDAVLDEDAVAEDMEQHVVLHAQPVHAVHPDAAIEAVVHGAVGDEGALHLADPMEVDRVPPELEALPHIAKLHAVEPHDS